MSDSTVFEAGQSLRRREMMKAVVVGTVGATAGAASSGTVAADDDGYLPEPGIEHAFVNPGLHALYNYVTTSGDGYTKESVEDMSEENTHLRIYNGADRTTRQFIGAIDNLRNYVETDDPTASPQAEMAYSQLRTTALQAVQDGEDPSDATSEGYDAAMEELTTPYVNLIRQWNEHIYDVVTWFLTLVEDDIEWSDDIDHDSGEVHEETGFVYFEDIDGAPDNSDVFRINTSSSDSPLEGFAVHVDEYDLPNGETHPVYVLELSNEAGSAGDGDYEIDDSVDGNSSNDQEPYVQGPDGDRVDIAHHVHLGTSDILNALDQIRSNVSSEATDTIEEIMDYYTSGDLEDVDILSSYDLMREYGDSAEMTRYTAELLAAGLDAPDDLTHEVTIDHPDVGERTGRLFLSWDWSELRSWEYEYDSDAGTLEIDPRSIDDDPELVVAFDDADDVTITDDDLDEDGVADLDVTDDEIESVERLSQGDLRGHIPVGQGTDHWDSAIFLYGDDDTNRTTLDTDEPFELVAVETEDGEELDALELEGWQNVERDPARSLREAERTADQYVTVDELEETGHGGGGGGGDSNTLLLGGAILTLLAMALAAVAGGDS